jgi:hypothetical protein
VLGAFAFASYFYSELSLLMGGPAWAGDLSVFRLHVSPLTSAPSWRGLGIMLAAVAARFAAAAWGLRARDVP